MYKKLSQRKNINTIVSLTVFFIAKYKIEKNILFFAEVAVIKNNFQRSVSINIVDINRDSVIR